MLLGADGAQIGTRFVASEESSAHKHFKDAVVSAKEGNTTLTLKELTPVRLLHNPFYQSVQDAYLHGATKDELNELLGKGRAKKGMFQGDLTEGELEIGQISGLIDNILPASTILSNLVKEYQASGIEKLGGKYVWA